MHCVSLKFIATQIIDVIYINNFGWNLLKIHLKRFMSVHPEEISGNGWLPTSSQPQLGSDDICIICMSSV